MYEYFGECRKLQDKKLVSWYDLELMKKKARRVSREKFEKNCGKFNSDNEDYTYDPSFGFYSSVLQGKKVYYWQYAGFEFIYKNS